jgi:hypothetical protein
METHSPQIATSLAEPEGETVTLKLPVFHCQMCEYRWLSAKGKKPRRCPNHECRSVRWDSAKYPGARPPSSPPPSGLPPEGRDGRTRLPVIGH